MRQPFFVRYYCPFCESVDELILSAESRTEALEEAAGAFVTCPSCLRRFTLKHEYILEALPLKAEKPVKAARESPTEIVSAKRFPDGSVSVTLRRGGEERSVTFPASEVKVFDQLMQIARRVGRDSYANAVLAVLVAHGAATKSLAAGFLQANGIAVSVDTVGEALSRAPYAYAATSPVKAPKIPRTSVAKQIVPDVFEKPPRGVKHGEPRATFMGEVIYYIPEPTRIHIIERVKLDPAFAWWRPEALEPVPLKRLLTREVHYEWVKVKRGFGRIRSEEDFKCYGPCREGEIVKLPLSMAYFLVHTGYAEWLNSDKQQVKEAEKIFNIEKVKRQVTLLDFWK